MNVGSILNNDSPPNTAQGEKDSEPQDSGFHRHSLVNLLNGPDNDAEPKTNEQEPTKGQKQVERQESVSSSESNDARANDKSQSEHVDEKKHDNETEERPNEDAAKAQTKKEEDDELARISKLNSTKKPRRYTVPPIWAQEWKASNQMFIEQAPQEVTTNLSSNPVFDRTLTVSVDLECSITGVIPPPSLTRTIAEWIYANFTEIPTSQRKYVELELKFGTIMDKLTGNRIDVNVSTECVYRDASGVYFDMGVHEVGWGDMCHFLEELEKKYQDELRKNHFQNANKPKRKFNVLESDITDSFYQITNRNEQPKSIRVSKDNTLNPPRYIAINKQRLSHLFIHNPSSMYDMRLSLSYENPIPESSIDSIIKKNTPSLIRLKKRTSYTHTPTVTRFDMTKVQIPRELKSKGGKKVLEQDQSHEVELEIDVNELFSGFDKVKNGVDSIRFEELVEIFMNNARCLNNRVTKLANR